LSQQSAVPQDRVSLDALLGSHAIKLFCYVETQQERPWVKDHSMSDGERAARSIDLDGFCAAPAPSG
jgi:hypothetical protein